MRLFASLPTHLFVNKDITATLVAEALKDIIPNSKPRTVTILDIQNAVGEHFSIRLEDFTLKTY